MSWTPTFWIMKAGFDEVKPKLKKLEEVEAWEFKIGNHKGVVLVANIGTMGYELLHDAIKNVPHWILDGEEECGCRNAYHWGREIHIKDEYDPFMS